MKTLLKLRFEIIVLVLVIFVWQKYFTEESPWVNYAEDDHYPVLQIKAGDHLYAVHNISQEMLFERHFCEVGEITAQIGGEDISYRIFENGIIFRSDRLFSSIIVFAFPDGTKTQIQPKKRQDITVYLKNNPSPNCGTPTDL